MDKKFTFEAHIGDKVSKTFDVSAPSENQASRDACKVAAALNLVGHSVRLVKVDDDEAKPAAENQPVTVSKPPKADKPAPAPKPAKVEKAPPAPKKPKSVLVKKGEKKAKGAA